jgi:hypothetical protein
VVCDLGGRLAAAPPLTTRPWRTPRAAEDERPLCSSTDAHLRNVLAAEGEPWLLIDCKPLVGPPAFDALPPVAAALQSGAGR